MHGTEEEKRLLDSEERRVHWKRWGPYLSERAWGTVREDYSAEGHAWEFFPHEHARSRAYRWNEDGIAGICDRHQRLCFALALWNGRDPILKERLFGLTGNEGNHGEDVKELYFYLDSTPTHSYMRMLYRYPQDEFPYARLVEENRRRTRADPELDLHDTGVFDFGRFFDVFVEYAKAGPDDICVRITAHNRGPQAAELHLLPTLWFRNRWSWKPGTEKPRLFAIAGGARAEHYLDLQCGGQPELLFCENETNTERLWRAPPLTRFPKDGINDCVVLGKRDCVNPAREGTKCAAHYRNTVAAGGVWSVKLRLWRGEGLGADFEEVFARRKREADEFYATVIPHRVSDDARNVMRQSLAGMLWSKQHYHYVVRDWLEGDPGQPPPPPERKTGRNSDWGHVYSADILSMPDKWEYPWFASWDLAFHCIPLALVDPDFAKEQLLLLLREWYMHPNGQIPAYEWAFGDVNPPVLAWAAWRVYKIERKRRGRGDRKFLKRVFHKLIINFTWWVNRKDTEGRNVFQGGFLGLDNIGVFDRSRPLPGGGHLEQSDGTSWMAMYCLNLLAIALELAREEDVYEDVASKFWEHFVHIARAMNTLGLWNEEDGFYYDILHRAGHEEMPIRLRSLVGLIPLLAVETVDPELLKQFPAFTRRLEWFIDNRPDLTEGVADMRKPGVHGRRLFAVVSPEKLARIAKVMFDEREFLSPYGIRSLSRAHADPPYRLDMDGHHYEVRYEPAESSTYIFGGNSNWRGPIWFPINFLLIEALQKFHHYLGDSFQIDFCGKRVTLSEAAHDISHRLVRLFLRGTDGTRPVNARTQLLDTESHSRDLLLFHEYFHGDTGAGVGASHQTGWTGLIAKLIQQSDGV